MTSKERLYKWVCEKSRHEEGRVMFGEIDDEINTYFIDIEKQPILEEYEINDKFDIEKYMEKYFDKVLAEVKGECIRSVLEGMSKVKTTDNIKSVQKSTGIREYIYNF